MTDIVLQSEKDFTDIRKKYEALIEKIFNELESQKEEQAKIKEQLFDVIEDNNRISSKIDIIRSAHELGTGTVGEHEQLTNDAICNLKQQVDQLKEERSTIKLLWQTSQETIVNLETEIQNYRKQLFKPSAFGEIKQRYSSAIKGLEQVIENQKIQISKQACTIRDLVTEKNHTNDRIQEFNKVILEQEKKISENSQLEKTNLSLKQQLKAVLHTNSELEISTSLAKSMIDERFIREKIALEKLQEALLIAETAMAEKEEALKRELVIKEECEALATTIGQVMEEAARKVEHDIECLKKQNEEKEKFLLKQHQEAMAAAQEQVLVTRAAEARCSCLEQKLCEVLKENSKLDKELQTATEALIQMELKLEATEQLLKEDKRLNTISEERESRITQYIESNHKLKERWKCTIEDVTKKFGNEVQRLQNENANLRAEIQYQRLKRNKMAY